MDGGARAVVLRVLLLRPRWPAEAGLESVCAVTGWMVWRDDDDDDDAAAAAA